ncbi:aminodeoxychorismate/anthranilate synthase component II [Akkermansia massiliensis]
MLGVCLGHQILGIRFGARLEHLSQPLHGVREPIRRTESCPLLEGLPEEFSAGLYHSWRLAATPWPEELVVTARDSGGNIQAIRHRSRPLYGIQFHPESILTPDGKSLLRDFLSLPANAVEGSPASNESMIHSQHQG